MPRQNRAKLFHPYDALKGFEETVHAKDAVYVRQAELADDAQERLDRKLRSLNRGNRVTVIRFQAKSGEYGQYVSVTGTVSRIDTIHGTVIIGNQAIPFRDIAEIGGVADDWISV